jgi:dTDP-4-dehydrorhamnose reductase
MKIVIVGSNGRLGTELARAYHKNYEVIGYNRSALDVENLAQLRETLHPNDFRILINCAAFTNVDLCESQRKRAFIINSEVPRELAEICRAKNARLIHFSTDYVFDGEKREPYLESDPANPISVYGESKRAGEENVLAAQGRHLVVRVSWVFGPDRPSFIDGVIKRARENEHVDAIADKFATPTYTKDIAEMLPRFFNPVAGIGDPGRAVRDRGNAGVNDSGYSDSGILHFANTGECSWQEYAQHALDCCHKLGVPLKARTVAPLKLSDMKNFIARRPIYSVLSTSKFNALAGKSPRSWQDAVAEYVRESVRS